MRSSDAGVRYVNPPSLERPPGYSHVVDVRGGRLIFIAGQAGVDAVGTVVGGDNLEAQADQSFPKSVSGIGECRLQRCKLSEAHRLHARHEQAGGLPPRSRSFLQHGEPASCAGHHVDRSLPPILGGSAD